MSTYDSAPETKKHIGEVRATIDEILGRLTLRKQRHDLSKLEAPEKPIFDEYTPKLRDCTYGSPEYEEFLKGMGEALDHHYAHNSHHPEHYAHGMADMDLVDLVEMFCDWTAATKRHADGDILKSVELNQQRFGYPDMLKAIMANTALRYFVEAPFKPDDVCVLTPVNAAEYMDYGANPAGTKFRLIERIVAEGKATWRVIWDANTKWYALPLDQVTLSMTSLVSEALLLRDFELRRPAEEDMPDWEEDSVLASFCPDCGEPSLTPEKGCLVCNLGAETKRLRQLLAEAKAALKGAEEDHA